MRRGHGAAASTVKQQLMRKQQEQQQPVTPSSSSSSPDPSLDNSDSLVTAVQDAQAAAVAPDVLQDIEDILVKGKATPVHGDMRKTSEMYRDALSVAVQAAEEHDVDSKVAAAVKRFFDRKYEPTWHCVVGRLFSGFMTHESQTFIFFYVGKLGVLLYKT